MKKRYYLLIATILLFGCFAIYKYQNVNADSKDLSNHKTYTQSAYDIKEDGWIYYFKIYSTDYNETQYEFNGYNLKYSDMDGYVIEVKDSSTNEVIDTIKPGYVSLINSKEYKDDIKNISSYFNENGFKKEISLEDLNDLTLKKLNREYIKELFNQAINKEKEEVDGKYAKAPVFGIKSKVSTDKNLEGTWQVAYLLDHGDIYKINIEFIDKKGNYVSDTKTNEDIINQINSEENNIINDQNIKLNNNINNDLKELLTELKNDLESYN